MIRLILLLTVRLQLPALVIIVSVAACATPPPAADDELRTSLIGKSKDAILACAGTPLQENQSEEGLVLRYYREAPMFDESGVFLKGSRPGVHRGCWVSLLFNNDYVVGAVYRAAPQSLGDVRLCDRIFESCHTVK